MLHCIVPQRDPLWLFILAVLLCIWNKWKLATERYAKWSSSQWFWIAEISPSSFLQSFTTFAWTALQTGSRTEVLPCLVLTPGKDRRYYVSYKQSFLCQRLKSWLLSRLTSLVRPMFNRSSSNGKMVNFVRKHLRAQILYPWILPWANR